MNGNVLEASEDLEFLEKRKAAQEIERVPRGTYRVKLNNLPEAIEWQELREFTKDVGEVIALHAEVIPEESIG